MSVDQEVVAKLAEVDMIVADLDRANSRVATVERRNVGSSLPSTDRHLSSSSSRKYCVLRLKPCAVEMTLQIGKSF